MKNERFGSGEGALSGPKSENYTDLLWQQASTLSAIRTPLEDLRNQLYQTVAEMRSRQLNLYEQTQLMAKENEYWRISEKIESITAQEDQVQSALEGLEAGTVDKATIQRLVPSPAPNTEQLSKRKQRILEDNKKLGIDPRETAWDMYEAFGSAEVGPVQARLTTGRHLSQIRGNFDSYTAIGEFFYQTADTHGGKVSYGKRGDSYTTAKGKCVRKV